VCVETESRSDDECLLQSDNALVAIDAVARARARRDYNVEKTLGEGSYGKALLVRNRKTGKLFTCKQLHEVDDDTSTEIDLLISVSGMSPFLCRYFDRFITHVDDE
jgi:hypothetical protein